MKDNQQFGGTQRRIFNHDIISFLKDYLDISLFKRKSKNTDINVPDTLVHSNEQLWNSLLINKCFPGQIMVIKDTYLMEWIPSSPGQYFTHGGRILRRGAMERSKEYINQNDKFIVLRPGEKESMVKGGIGSLRLGPKKIDNEDKYIVGISSTGVSHEGIPAILNKTLFLKIVDVLKTNAIINVDIVGTLKLLPIDNFGIHLHYNEEVPKYYLEIEEVTILKNKITPIVSVAILYENDTSDFKYSFCTFSPEQNDKEVKLAAEWLKEYALKFSKNEEPSIIGDFDEYYEHFDRVTLPIIQIANGHVPIEELRKLQKKLKFHIDLKNTKESAYLTRSEITTNSEISKNKILFLSSTPIDSSRLRIEEEAREIREGLQRAKKRDMFTIEFRFAVRPRDMLRAILDENPQILHFSGHGAHSGIILEDNDGHSMPISTAGISQLFNSFKDEIKCVVLNACYSENQAKEIAKYVPYVIGMNDAIPDNTAITFATTFYDAIGAGKDFESAFNIATASISFEGLAGNNIPVLIKKDNSTKKSTRSA